MFPTSTSWFTHLILQNVWLTTEIRGKPSESNCYKITNLWWKQTSRINMVRTQLKLKLWESIPRSRLVSQGFKHSLYHPWEVCFLMICNFAIPRGKMTIRQKNPQQATLAGRHSSWFCFSRSEIWPEGWRCSPTPLSRRSDPTHL